MIPLVFLAATLGFAGDVSSISAPANVRVEIVTQARDVVITGVPNSSVVTTTAPDGMRRPVMTTMAGGVIRITDPDKRDFPSDVLTARYEIRVPADAHVSLNCPICRSTIAKVASVDLDTDSGKTVIDHIVGNVNAASLSGTVEISDVGGKVEASSQTYSLSLRNIKGAAIVRSVTGTIMLNSVTGGATATNTTGEVHLRGAVGPSATYSLETHTGHVRVYLDPGASATIEVNTPENTLRFREPIARRSTDHDRRTTLVVGSGTTKILAQSFSGAVDVMPSSEDRRRD